MSNILAIPCPMDVETLPYLERLKYVGILVVKNVLLKIRDKREPDSIQDKELLIFTMNGYTEFFRATKPSDLSEYMKGTKELTIKLTKETDIIFIRVGDTIKDWLNTNKISLKIEDIHGNINNVDPIRTKQIFNNKYN